MRQRPDQTGSSSRMAGSDGAGTCSMGDIGPDVISRKTETA